MEIGKNVYIHPSVRPYLPEDIVIGDDTKIYAFVALAPKVVIGHGCKIGNLVNFEAGVEIGKHVTIYSQSHLTTGLVIEDYAWIGPMFMGLNTNKIRHVRDFDLVIEPPRIKRGARIGAGVGLNPGITIGEEALIAAWSRVTKNVPAGEYWRGFPARKIGDVPKEEMIDYYSAIQKCDLCNYGYEKVKKNGG